MIEDKEAKTQWVDQLEEIIEENEKAKQFYINEARVQNEKTEKDKKKKHIEESQKREDS